jgi:chromosome segregation ATPase
MVLLENKYDYTFKSANVFLEQLKSLQQQLPPLLDDFEKYYVFYNMNSANSEYQQMFENIKKNLDSLSSKSFMLLNSVESEINSVSKKLISLDASIQKEKDTNKKLESKIGNIKEKQNSSDIMINNYKIMYGIGYVKNWAIFLSIIAAGFAISKISSNKLPVNIIQK